MTLTSVESIESALSALLDALAVVLLRLEVTPARLSQIARASFVKAGATQARKRSSGRPHIARIAALTGLSRVEVKRIVESKFAYGKRQLDASPRAHRVLSAWHVSKTYARSGKPKVLRVMGAAPSFASLCKTYSGDIPYRVIYDELKRNRSITVSRDRKSVSVNPDRSRNPEVSSTYAALLFATNFLIGALREDRVLIRRRERVHATSTVPSTYIEAAVAGRVTELLDQIPHLFPKKKGRKKDAIEIFALVSRSTQDSEGQTKGA
jgi:hypothetical protein